MSVEAREAEVAGVDAGVSVNPAPTQPACSSSRMADGDAMQDELELEFRRLCGGESERHDILQETIQRQQAELQEFRRRCREQDEELRRLRQKPVEAQSPAEGGVKTDATPEWIRQLCQREGIDPIQGQAEFTTAWTCEEEGRADREFDVSDPMDCLHGQFRCQGQPLPIMPGVPQTPLQCCISSTLTAGELIPELPEPALSHHVETVIEAARCIAIWQGVGTRAEKVKWITDPDHRRITPKSVALAYAFFKSRCVHVAVMSSVVPKNGIMRHAHIPGWGGDITHIFESAWRIASNLSWEAAKGAVGKEHRKVVVVVPQSLRALKRVNGLRDTLIFYYKLFKDIHLRRTHLFDDNIGHVIFVLPSIDPLAGSWLPFMHAVNMWLACGCSVYLVAGPRTADDNAWYRVADCARRHVNAFVDSHPQYQRQIVDKLPLSAGVVDPRSPCFVLGILETADAVVAERSARLFYSACARQLVPWIQMEPLPSGEMKPRLAAGRAEASGGHSSILEGKIHKRRERRRAQKQKRNGPPRV